MKKFWNYIEEVGCFTPTATAIVLWVMLLLMSSCRAQKEIQYVDREVVKYETKIQHDTFINISHDSIFYSVFQKGDTVYETKYIEKTAWKDKYIYCHDTLYRDSIQVQNKEIIKEVTKIPQIYHLAMWICIFLITYLIYRLIRWINELRRLW